MSTEQNRSKAGAPSPERLGWEFDSATKIVNDLFELGDEPNSPTHRIEFKGGRYTVDLSQERAQGGLCKTALIEWLARSLKRNVPNTEA